MNPDSIGQAKKLFLEIRKGLSRYKHSVEVVVAPPFVYLSELERLSPSKRILLAAQDVFFEKSGAYTGEISLPMLKSVGVTHAIIGHSERRALGETDEDIYHDTVASIKSSVMTIVCVGENKRDSHGEYFNFVEHQITAAVADIPKSKLASLAIAYEPIWAIGTGKTATPEDVQEMRLFIQKVLTDMFGRTAAAKIRILYGGSVKAANAEELLTQGEVDGFLVGGASLKPKEFISIIKTTAQLNT